MGGFVALTQNYQQPLREIFHFTECSDRPLTSHRQFPIVTWPITKYLILKTQFLSREPRNSFINCFSDTQFSITSRSFVLSVWAASKSVCLMFSFGSISGGVKNTSQRCTQWWLESRRSITDLRQTETCKGQWTCYKNYNWYIIQAFMFLLLFQLRFYQSLPWQSTKCSLKMKPFHLWPQSRRIVICCSRRCINGSDSTYNTRVHEWWLYTQCTSQTLSFSCLQNIIFHNQEQCQYITCVNHFYKIRLKLLFK